MDDGGGTPGGSTGCRAAGAAIDIISALPRSSKEMRSVRARITTSGAVRRWPMVSACLSVAALTWGHRTHRHNAYFPSLPTPATGDSPPPSDTTMAAASACATTKSNTTSSLATSKSSASKISTKTWSGSLRSAERISGFARNGWNFRTTSSTAPSRSCCKATPSSVPGIWKRQYWSNSKGAVSANALSIRWPMASKRPEMPSISAILRRRSAFAAAASKPAWFSE
mmetsp:Transcript_58527/g.163209  ORF Transcript_58527/g.163209 Transcript_58527/m.163209 type:complete len:226 (+) Transcript_58527:773-1450(+)